MSFKATAVANTLLDIAKAHGQTLTNMQLQKLIYFAQGWALAYRGVTIVDEQAEAWPYGPVFPSVYHEFKRFGSAPILTKATEFDPKNWLREVPSVDNPDAKAFLESIWASYGKFSGPQLSQMTHVDDGPWALARRESQGMRSTDIPLGSITQYFQNLRQKSEAPAAAPAA